MWCVCVREIMSMCVNEIMSMCVWEIMSMCVNFTKTTAVVRELERKKVGVY